MSPMRARVLVTGAGGFCGSHLVESLLADGFEVRAFVRYNGRGDAGWLAGNEHPELHIVFGDVEDASAVLDATAGVEIVYHLAALVGIPYSYVHPEEVLRSNTIGTFNVLTACRRSGVRRLVHTSTSEVYGTARYVPIDEAHPLQAQSPYAASKIAADQLAESFHRSFGLPVVTLRPFNMYGPRQSTRAVIPTIVQALLAGPHVRLGALAPTRDFTFVEDTVRALRLAGEAPRALEGRTFNAGSGKEISIGALAEKIGALLGVAPEIETEDERRRPAASEVERLVADSTRARADLGWEPSVSLSEGLTRTIEWFRARPASRTGYRI